MLEWSDLIFLAVSTSSSFTADAKWTLVTSSSTVSLTRREADLAVRLERPSQADLVARKLGTYAYALYASPSYLAKRPAPAGTDLAGHEVLGFAEELSFPRGRIAVRARALLRPAHEQLRRPRARRHGRRRRGGLALLSG